MSGGIGTASIVTLIPSTGEVGGTWGSTGAVATRKLHGIQKQTFTIAEVVESVPMVGYYGASPVADEQQQSGEFSLEGIATYQEMPKFYNGFFSYTSGSTGSADPYPFYWAAPVASTQASATYCLEFGTTGMPYRSLGSIFNELRISGEAGGYWQFTIGGFSKAIQASSGLSATAFADSRTMVPIRMADTNVYLNAFTTGAYQSTSGLVDATLVSFELNYNPNRHLKFFAGSKYPGGWGDARAEATLTTVLEFNSTSRALLNELLASSTGTTSTGTALQRQIMIKASAISTAGSSGFVSIIDFAGVAGDNINMWDDRDGNCTVEIQWRGKFSTAMTCPTSTNGNYLGFTIYNGSSSTT